MMRIYWVILASILFTGCDLLKSHSVSGMPSHLNVIVAGQSNAFYMADEGMTAFQRRVGIPMTIYNCGIHEGATGLQWLPTGDAYKRCVDTVVPANTKIDVILYWQGESEAVGKTPYQPWAQNVLQTFAAFRTQYGAMVPIYMASLGETRPEFPVWAIMRSIQQSIHCFKTHIVSLDNVGFENGIHYFIPGYQHIQERFALAVNEN